MGNIYSRILDKEFKRNGNGAKIVKVPKEKRPTASSVRQLQKEIDAQAEQNIRMHIKTST